METPNIQKARKLAFEYHEGQFYGKYPYCFHLMDVVRTLLEYGYDDEDLIIAGYCHDLIEDTSVTKGVLEVLFNKKVANLVDAVSGEGADRYEKKQSMITKLNLYPKAIPIKMADRLVNMKNCYLHNNRLLKMYVIEMDDYKDLFMKTDMRMWEEMCNLAY